MSESEAASRARQPTTRLEPWLAERGFWENPFGEWNAEHEQDLPNYFVDTGGFDELLRETKPCVILAWRGCGKTAQRQMLAAQCRPLSRDNAQLAVVYTYGGFERALRQAGNNLEQLQPAHHVHALLYLALKALKEESGRDAGVQDALACPEVAARLSSYMVRFAPHLVVAPGVETAPSLDSLGSPELMEGFVLLLRSVGIKSLVVLMDGLDEFSLTASEPAKAIAFLKPLLGTLSLIECPGWSFKFYLPQELEPTLYNCRWFRPDRVHRVSGITWNKQNILNMISRRLIYFSSRERPREALAQLCEDELGQVIDRELVSLAGGLPRAALVLANMLLHTHCQQPKPPDVIGLEIWEQVREEWQDRRTDFVTEDRLRAVEPFPVLDQGKSEHLTLQLEEDKGLVWLGRWEIRSEINPQEYAVLACLYRHQGEVCKKNRIIQEAWPEEESEGVSDQAIAASIARLRSVLRKFEPMRRYIETFRGKNRDEGGYRLHPAGFD